MGNRATGRSGATAGKLKKKCVNGHGARDAARIDYAHKLTPAEREWLDNANQTLHCGERDDTLSPEQQTEAYSTRNCANRDAFNLRRRVCAPANSCEQWLDATSIQTPERVRLPGDTDADVADALGTLFGREPPPSKYKRQMGPEDWRAAHTSAEDALIEAIDADAFRQRAVR